MKNRFIFAALAVAFLFAGTVSAQSYAWWLTKTYNPKDTQIEGIPVQNIRKSWKVAQVFSRSTFSKKELADQNNSPDFQPTWDIRRDINRDGKEDRALVGVARTNKGLERFFLVLTRDGNKWKTIYSNTSGTEPKHNDMGFAYMVDQGKDGILWMDCFQCDVGYGRLKWNGKKFVLKDVWEEGYD